MKKLLSIIVLLSILDLYLTAAEDVSCECTISNLVWPHFNRQSTCSVKSNLNIKKEDTTIVSINGNCQAGQPNEDVRFFSVLSKTVYYIPKGLDVVFKNLTGMKFQSTNLKHVTKENLRPFPQLLMFASVSNQVQFIEKDLFEYNLYIEFVSFRSNRISFIDSKVFDVIRPSLVQLYIDGTAISCGFVGAANKNAVGKILDKLPTSPCSDLDNAPPLYSLWLELQGGSGNKCEAEIAAKDAEIAAKDAEIAGKEAECEQKIKEEKQIQSCVDDPTQLGCPQNDALKNLQKN